MYTKIKELHLEITNQCNSRCPQCSRTFGTTLEEQPWLTKNPNELSADEIRKIVFDPALQHIESCYINGNYGDIVMHNDPMSVIEVLAERKLHSIRIHTNGGAQSTTFWKELAKYSPKLMVYFAIDGLEDTHHLYRRNTRYDVVMKNARAFIDAGGKAVWQFIKFEHNKHQLEEAKNRSQEYGFRWFEHTMPYNKKELSFGISVKDKNFEHSYWLGNKGNEKDIDNPQTLQDQYNGTKPIVKRMHEVTPVQFINLVNDSPIKCRPKDDQVLYIGSTKRVWPCCFLGGRWSRTNDMDIEQSSLNNYFKEYVEKFGEHFNSIEHYSISDILNNLNNFKKIEQDWNTPSACGVCTTICSSSSDWKTKEKKKEYVNESK